MSRDARYQWAHYIPHRKSDALDGPTAPLTPRPPLRLSITLRSVRPPPYGAMQKLRIVTKGFRVGDRSRGRYATPAEIPRHDGTPYRGLRVRRWGLGCVHHSWTILNRPVPQSPVPKT